MNKLIRFACLFLLCLTEISSMAKDYTVREIPMVHLQDRTRYVSNPDGILSSGAVATIDSLLYALEQQTGIQTLVVVVSGIEGGDCFDFAHQLGEQAGVGQKGRDNGLVILLSTNERCIQFATGYGLEGVLPDAMCKRIQNRYMLPAFRDNDWNTGMVEGLRAVSGCLDGSMENLVEEEEDDVWVILLVLFAVSVLVLTVLGLLIKYSNRCPQCKKSGLQRTHSRTISRRNGVRTEEVTYVCRYCGYTCIRKEQSEDDSYRGMPRGGGPLIMGGGRGGGFSGSSFGGGSFGGGGAGSRF